MNRDRDLIVAGRRLSIDWLAAVLLLFIGITAPSFLEDDAGFFNYFANVIGAKPLFYYNGYVSFIAGPIAYALSGLPFPAQAMLYRVAPLVALFLCYRELAKLIALRSTERDARWLALAMIVLARGVDLNIWSNLTYSIWPAFFAAVFHLLRVSILGGRLSPIAIAGVLLASLSIPLGILTGVMLIALAIRGGASRTTFGVLGGMIVVLQLLVLSGAPTATIVTIDPLRIARMFVESYRTDFKLNTLVVALSMSGLAVMAVRAWRKGDADRTIVWSLAFIGFGSVAAYVVSDRFVELEGGFRSQHALPVMFAAMIAFARGIVTLNDQRRRALLMGVCFGISAAAFGREMYFHLRGPLEVSLMRYEFLSVAQQYRRECQDGGGAMLFEDDSASPLVLCKPREFAAGRRYPMLNFVPVLGASGPADEDTRERPGLFVGRPLF